MDTLSLIGKIILQLNLIVEKSLVSDKKLGINETFTSILLLKWHCRCLSITVSSFRGQRKHSSTKLQFFLIEHVHTVVTHKKKNFILLPMLFRNPPSFLLICLSIVCCILIWQYGLIDEIFLFFSEQYKLFSSAW